MGKYIVCEGQNLFDVSLHIHGSIEGIIDLLICNPSLSLAGELRSGDELSYTDDFVIDADTVAYYRMYGIKPANGERTVYYKSSEHPKLAEIYLENSQTSVCFEISGNGTLEISTTFCFQGILPSDFSFWQRPFPFSLSNFVIPEPFQVVFHAEIH